MDVQTIERNLLQFNNGAITMNISQIAKSRCKGRQWARELMEGVDCFIEGKSKEYLVKDVAKRMYTKRGF